VFAGLACRGATGVASQRAQTMRNLSRAQLRIAHMRTAGGMRKLNALLPCGAPRLHRP
jgi:hypothetical protein